MQTQYKITLNEHPCNKAIKPGQIYGFSDYYIRKTLEYLIRL